MSAEASAKEDWGLPWRSFGWQAIFTYTRFGSVGGRLTPHANFGWLTPGGGLPLPFAPCVEGC